MNYDNEHCKIAAQMLETEPSLLDYRLVEYLNKINNMMGGGLGCRFSDDAKNKEVIALAIVQWQENKMDDFTRQPKS